MKVDRYGRSILVPSLSVAVLLLTPLTVMAHAVNKRFGDFYGGMFHPLTSVVHLFPLIGLGLLAGLQGPSKARWALPTLLVGLLVGGLVGWYFGKLIWISMVNKASLILVGILVVTAARIPAWGISLLALLVALSHGHENGSDASGSATLQLFLAGVLTSGLLLVAVPAAVVVSLQAAWQRIAVRVLGSWVAATGLLILSVP